MVIFNDLRISEDMSCLIVDCQIEDLTMYRGMYIDSIYVEYYKNVSEDGIPSDSAYLLYSKKELEAPKTGMRKYMNITDVDPETFGTDTFEGGLFFVTVVCDGELSREALESMAGCDCGRDNTIDTGVVVDWYSVYKNGISYAAQFAYGCSDPCNPPMGYEAFVLAWYSLRLAIDTCNWILVRKLWDKFNRALRGASGVPESGRNCGCGR